MRVGADVGVCIMFSFSRNVRRGNFPKLLER
jgi:hypothetical protein